MAKRTVKLSYSHGDSVVIDGCDSIRAVVLATQLRGDNISYQVSYWGNGQMQEHWVEEWRLTPWAE